MANALNVKIGGDVKGLENALNSAMAKVQQAGRSMSELGKTLSMRVTAPLVAFGGVAVRQAGNFERLRTSMDVLNGSVEEGARNFERLQEFSARTPFQLQDLAKAQNMLQGFGLAADDAFEALERIGDISAITGGSIEGIGIAFGQAAAEGKVMTRDIRQFINQGVPMVKLLAETMGVAQSEIFDLASQGEITFEILQEAFRGATEEGGMFADGMAKQSQTINGLFSTLKDNIALAMGEVGDSIVDALSLRTVIPDLIKRIGELTNWFKNLSDEARRNILVFAGLVTAVGPVLFVVGKLITASASVALALGKITVAVKAVTAAMMANPYLAIAAGVLAISTKVFLANRRLSRMNDLVEQALNIAPTGTQDEIDRINEAIVTQEKLIANIIKQHETMGVVGTEASKKQLAPMREVLDALIATRDEAALLQVDGIISDKEIANSKNLSTAIEGINRQIEKVRVNAVMPEDTIFDLAEELELRRLRDEFSQFNDALYEFTQTDWSDPIVKLTANTGGLSNAMEFAKGVADDFTNSFGQGMANIIVQGEKLMDTLKNIGKLLLSSAIQTGLRMLLMGSTGGAGGVIGGLFGSIFNVNDALITSGGDVVKFHKDDNILAMKDFSNLNTGGGMQKVEVFGKLQGNDIFISSNRGGVDYGR